MRYLRNIKEFYSVCGESERNCPKGYKICCRICKIKKDISQCSGDDDQGCGEWEIGYCDKEIFDKKPEAL